MYTAEVSESVNLTNPLLRSPSVWDPAAGVILMQEVWTCRRCARWKSAKFSVIMMFGRAVIWYPTMFNRTLRETTSHHLLRRCWVPSICSKNCTNIVHLYRAYCFVHIICLFVNFYASDVFFLVFDSCLLETQINRDDSKCHDWLLDAHGDTQNQSKSPISLAFAAGTGRSTGYHSGGFLVPILIPLWF